MSVAAIFSSAIVANGSKLPAKLSQGSAESTVLTLLASGRIPLNEVSALAWDGDDVLAIGDNSADLVRFRFSEKNLKVVKVENVENSLKKAGIDEKKPGFEALVADAQNLYFLSEHASKIVVLKKEDLSFRSVIELKLTDSSLEKDWNADDNSRGEGMVLLNNGHILVAKEKKPSALLEFAPNEKKPKSFFGKNAVSFLDKFPLPDGHSIAFHLVKSWTLDATTSKSVKDVSELEVSSNGDLFFASAKSKLLGKVGVRLELGNEFFQPSKIWKLPKELKTLEGFVFQKDGTLIVATDTKKADLNNVFVLSALK